MKSKVETSMYMQRFIADMNDMGQSHCFHTDNGGEFTSRSYVDCCDSVGIRRECTAPGEPQQNAVVESAIWCAMKGDHAARRENRRLFSAVDYAKIPNIGANATAYGWKLSSGLPTASTALRLRLTPGGRRCTKFS